MGMHDNTDEDFPISFIRIEEKIYLIRVSTLSFWNSSVGGGAGACFVAPFLSYFMVYLMGDWM